VHRVEDGQIREHLVALNGPICTLTRGKGGVTCQLSASHSVSVPGHGLGKDVFPTGMPDLRTLRDHYGVHPLGGARVAGRFAEVVGVTPRDHLRYGYRFYLDRESGLLLKSDLMGQRADPIEQVMFTSLNLLPSQGSTPARRSGAAATAVCTRTSGSRLAALAVRCPSPRFRPSDAQ